MNLNDPSLYGVTYPQREIGIPFMGAIPTPWQNVPRFMPQLHAYGMQPVYPYGMQPLYPYGMQPFYPYAPDKLGAQPFPGYGTQPFPPQAFGYTTPFQTAPLVPSAFNPCLTGGACSVPFSAPMQGWQRFPWY